jgi:hypothetical protein
MERLTSFSKRWKSKSKAQATGQRGKRTWKPAVIPGTAGSPSASSAETLTFNVDRNLTPVEHAANIQAHTLQDLRPDDLNDTDIVSSASLSPEAVKAKEKSERLTSENLWERAYWTLFYENENLVTTYQEVLVSTSKTKDAATTDLGDEPGGFVRQVRVADLIQEQLVVAENHKWRLHLGDKSVEVRTQVEKLVKVVVLVKDVVALAVHMTPYGALAWAGVCILLPVSD